MMRYLKLYEEINFEEDFYEREYFSPEELYEDISKSNLKINTDIGEWEVSYDYFDGTVNWWNKDEGVQILATPYWEGMPSIPIDVHDSDGEMKMNDRISLENRSDIISMDEYLELITTWINRYKDDIL